MVIAGHMGILLGSGAPQFLQQDVHSLGVKVLFLIGGYFIALSWENDSHPLRYMVKRLCRIYPPLAVTILLSAYIMGPLMTKLDLRTYLTHSATSIYVRYNLRMFPVFFLPGVFEQNPYPNAVNGSLWTLPIEMIFYMLVPILLTVLKKVGKNAFLICVVLTGVACGFQIYQVVWHPQWVFIAYGTDWTQAVNLLPFYMIGILFTFPQIKKYCNMQRAIIFLLLASCLQTGTALNFLLLYTVLPYFIFSFGWAENPDCSKMFPQEISYGMYLYGFPIQQCVISLSQKFSLQLNFVEALLISVPIIVLFAQFSFLTIEKWSANICGKILLHINSSVK